MSDLIPNRDLFEESLSAVSLHTIVLDEAGAPIDYVFDSVNRAFEELTGLSRGAILGKSVLTVLPKTEKDWIERYGQVALTGIPASFESRSQEFGKWFQVTAFQHKPLGFTACFVDVTKRQLEHELALAAEAKYRAFFEIGAVKLVIDPHTGGILDANNQAAEFYGYPLEVLKRMTIGQINQLSKADIDEEMRSAASRRRNVFTFHHKKADGTVLNVEVHSNPALWNGQDALFSIIFDVTELTVLRKKALQEERLAAIGALTASLNHEFGNMLAVLSLQFQLMELKMEDTPERQKIVALVTSQFGRSQKLVDSIKRLSRAETLQKERCNLGQILGDVLQLESPICKEKRIRFGLDIVEDEWVNADIAMIQQVFLNLFNNAVQALEGVNDPVIRIEVRRETTEVVVRVANNGAEIPAVVRPKLFVPFFTTKAKNFDPGSGLGLSFAASVVHAHGGVIFLEDRLETVFQVRLPVALN